MFKVFIIWPILFLQNCFWVLKKSSLSQYFFLFSHPVLIIPPKTDVDTVLFSDRLRSLLVRLYLGALAAELRATTNPLFVDHSLPAVCVQVRAYTKLQTCILLYGWKNFQFQIHIRFAQVFQPLYTQVHSQVEVSALHIFHSGCK